LHTIPIVLSLKNDIQVQKYIIHAFGILKKGFNINLKPFIDHSILFFFTALFQKRKKELITIAVA